MDTNPQAAPKPSPEFIARHHLPADTPTQELADWARYEQLYPDAHDLYAGEDLYAEKD
jgi:hypothetical protein